MNIEELLEQYRDNDYYNLSKIENITKLCEEIERLKARIDKAIEYIEIYNEEDNPDYGSSFINKNDYSYVLFDEYRESLLNILRGEDNE